MEQKISCTWRAKKKKIAAIATTCCFRGRKICSCGKSSGCRSELFLAVHIQLTSFSTKRRKGNPSFRVSPSRLERAAYAKLSTQRYTLSNHRESGANRRRKFLEEKENPIVNITLCQITFATKNDSSNRAPIATREGIGSRARPQSRSFPREEIIHRDNPEIARRVGGAKKHPRIKIYTSMVSARGTRIQKCFISSKGHGPRPPRLARPAHIITGSSITRLIDVIVIIIHYYY